MDDTNIAKAQEMLAINAQLMTMWPEGCIVFYQKTVAGKKRTVLHLCNPGLQSELLELSALLKDIISERLGPAVVETELSIRPSEKEKRI